MSKRAEQHLSFFMELYSHFDYIPRIWCGRGDHFDDQCHGDVGFDGRLEAEVVTYIVGDSICGEV